LTVYDAGQTIKEASQWAEPAHSDGPSETIIDKAVFSFGSVHHLRAEVKDSNDYVIGDTRMQITINPGTLNIYIDFSTQNNDWYLRT